MTVEHLQGEQIASVDQADTSDSSVPAKRTHKRVRPREFKPSDVLILFISALSSYSIVWILFDQLTLLNGALGFVVIWIPLFLFMYWVVNRQLFTRQVAIDRVIGSMVTLGAGLMMLPLVMLTIFVVQKGLPQC